jgi:2,3-bisphosphoglycerate-independent phosphoglycerate mutase
LAIKLRQVKIPGIEVFVEPVKEHRFVVVFRAPGLGGDVYDTDPQVTGVPPLAPLPSRPESAKTAEVAREFIAQAQRLLSAEPKANGLTLRGFSERPALPTFAEVYGLRAAAIAVYPMYKGLARLVGMTLVGNAQTLDEQLSVLEEQWANFDFFFIHFKYTDSTGEDGNFQAKVQRIEELDAAMPRLMALGPTVLIVTGDHSTPSRLRTHSWHPVPTLLLSDVCRSDLSEAFSERECLRGGLGQFEAKYLMSLALANAGRLGKYGA